MIRKIRGKNDDSLENPRIGEIKREKFIPEKIDSDGKKEKSPKKSQFLRDEIKSSSLEEQEDDK